MPRLNSCKKGQIMRDAYTKKSGTHVKAKCITATSRSGSKRSVEDKQITKKLERAHTQARKKFGIPKCKKGEILKEGYKRQSRTTSNSSWVAPTCVKSKTGRPHGKQLFRLAKGDLKQFGYENVKNMTVKERHSALSRAINSDPLHVLSIYRKINALHVVNIHQDPELSQIFKSDADWIKSTNVYQNRPTANMSRQSSRRSSRKPPKKSSKNTKKQ